MTVIAGIDMAIGSENTGRMFQISYQGTLRPYWASNMAGGAGRNEGVTRWRGQYLGYGHTPARFPGDSFTFTGSVDGTNGVTGTALCDAIVIRGSLQRGGPIEYMVKYTGISALTLGAAAAADETNPNPPDALDMKIDVDGTDEDDVTDVVMEITARNRYYASSTTPGVTKGVAGGIDARVMWRLLQGTVTSLQTPNTNAIVKAYVTSTTFWQFSKMRVESLGDFTADHEGSDPVGGTILASMNGANAGAGIGCILNPAEACKWGTAPE